MRAIDLDTPAIQRRAPRAWHRITLAVSLRRLAARNHHVTPSTAPARGMGRGSLLPPAWEPTDTTNTPAAPAAGVEDQR